MATINGTSGNDNLNGTSGNDTVNGLGGNDTLIGSGGADFYDGGAGSDTLDLRATAAGVTVSFASATISGGFTGTFANMERVLGSDGADSLIGATGNQTLSSRGGNDMLAGGAGNDTLWGGSGADSFVFRETGTANADSMADFASGSDKIVLDGSAMTALGASGNFAAGDARFVANTSGTAQDADDRIIYETDTRQIWYDPDGTGTAARQLIANLQSGATLVATDIEVEGQGGGPAPIVGTEGDDTLTGTDGNDTIDGRGGNDSLRGNEGLDLLVGGDGNDTLVAAFDDDHGEDTLDGGLGDDVYYVNGFEDVILPDPGGVDTVQLDRGDFTLGEGLENLNVLAERGMGGGIGNELDNVMTGGQSFQGKGGNDLLATFSSGGSTSAHGGEGNDTLAGGGLRTFLFGDAGDDVLRAETEPFWGEANELTGGAGADSFVFTQTGFTENLILDFASGTDKIVLDGDDHMNIGASGRFATSDARFAANSTGTAQDPSDRVIYNTSTGELWYDADGSGSGAAGLIATLQSTPALAATDIEVVNGTTQPPSGNVINGTSGNDTLTGTAGDDVINGLGGNDLFLAGSTGGADTIDGGEGRDSIEFKERATSAIQVDFVVGTITGASGTINFTNIERVVAGNFHDELTGNDASQTLTGQGGADTIWGAGGADTLWGGSGADNFLFREMGTANADRISDFATGADVLWLDDVAFTAIGADGRFAAGDVRFKANSSGTATDTNDRVVFNTSTGQLYYDADGSGGAAAQLIGTVQSGATVAATDIVVI